MEKTGRTRRSFLKGLVFFGAFGFLLWRFLVPPHGAQKKTLLTVKKNNIPPEGALVYRRSRIAVIQQDKEYYALSLICTHLGCTVNVTPNTLICPCHGSVFDRDGNVLKGPASQPLERLQIEEEGNSLIISA